jgi:integrase
MYGVKETQLIYPTQSVRQANHKSVISKFNYAPPNILLLRDGELVLYKRKKSPYWQCTFKLQDGQRLRISTKKASIENATTAACEIYDECRFRQRLGLAHRSKTFSEIAHETLNELHKKIDLGKGKTAYHSYVSCIEKYFLPFFSSKRLEDIANTDISDFEIWRNKQMGKIPKASTLNNFASAWSQIVGTAVSRGWISERVPIPKLSIHGAKSKPRPAFTREEVDFLLFFMKVWSTKGRLSVEREMRPLLRDYVEMLLYTGMRHGTEALGITWKDITWYTDKGTKYLRIWVDGKTGGRWLIAKHDAVDVLKRLHKRQEDVKEIEFEDLLKSTNPKKIFRFSDGYQPPSLNGTFRRLMRDCGLEKGEDGQNRTLYSIRHTYATLELLEKGTNIHTLAKQMGNSASMIERHYSKLTATMAAEKLA